MVASLYRFKPIDTVFKLQNVREKVTFDNFLDGTDIGVFIKNRRVLPRDFECNSRRKIVRILNREIVKRDGEESDPEIEASILQIWGKKKILQDLRRLFDSMN